MDILAVVLRAGSDKEGSEGVVVMEGEEVLCHGYRS